MKSGKSKEELEVTWEESGRSWKKLWKKIPNPHWKRLYKYTYLPDITKTPLYPVGSAVNLRASKYGGCPYIPEGTEYPTCIKCKGPISFFLQLNSDDLPTPERPFGEGLFQLFYCTKCGLWTHEEKKMKPRSTISRVLDLSSLPPPRKDIDITTIMIPSENYQRGSSVYFKEMMIKGDWKKRIELPGYSDKIRESESEYLDMESWIRWELFGDYSKEKKEDGGVILDQIEEIWEYDESNDLRSLESDKYLGYPAYIQNDETPNCRVCNKECLFFYQIVSENLVDYSFNDCGIAHLWVCEDHKNEIQLTWSSC